MKRLDPRIGEILFAILRSLARMEQREAGELARVFLETTGLLPEEIPKTGMAGTGGVG